MHKFEIFCKTIFNSPEPLTFDPGLYVTPVVTFFFLKMTMFDGARKCQKTTKVLSKTGPSPRATKWSGENKNECRRHERGRAREVRGGGAPPSRKGGSGISPETEILIYWCF